MDIEKEETQLQYFGISSSLFEKEYPNLVVEQVEVLVDESINFLKNELNKQPDLKNIKTSITQKIMEHLDPFIISMTGKFDKCLIIPDSVPFLGEFNATQQNIPEDTLDQMRAKFSELVNIFLKRKYLLEATKSEINTYDKIEPVLTIEDSTYKKISNLTNEVITVKDVAKLY